MITGERQAVLPELLPNASIEMPGMSAVTLCTFRRQSQARENAPTAISLTTLARSSLLARRGRRNRWFRVRCRLRRDSGGMFTCATRSARWVPRSNEYYIIENLPGALQFHANIIRFELSGQNSNDNSRYALTFRTRGLKIGPSGPISRLYRLQNPSHKSTARHGGAR